jgi:pyruvate kinase
MFSFGVYPVCQSEHPEDWKLWASKWLEKQEITGDLIVMTEGPSAKHPERNIRMEIIDLRINNPP